MCGEGLPRGRPLTVRRLAGRPCRSPLAAIRAVADCQGAVGGGEDGDGEDLSLEFQFKGHI
jgi:hypothetical protein